VEERESTKHKHPWKETTLDHTHTHTKNDEIAEAKSTTNMSTNTKGTSRTHTHTHTHTQSRKIGGSKSQKADRYIGLTGEGGD